MLTVLEVIQQVPSDLNAPSDEEAIAPLKIGPQTGGCRESGEVNACPEDHRALSQDRDVHIHHREALRKVSKWIQTKPNQNTKLYSFGPDQGKKSGAKQSEHEIQK